MTEAKKIALQVAEFQRLLLPREFPSLPGFSFAVHYQPCEAAGGDFYGWQVWPDGSLGIGVADVSGHGIRAAIVMAMLRSWLAAYKHFARPAETIVTDLNGFFAEVVDLKSFVTIVFVHIDPRDGSLSFRNCGHPSPRLRKRNGSVVVLDEGRSLPLGILIDEPPADPMLAQLDPGDALVLFTDGIPESAGIDGSFFDDDRLNHAIADCDGQPESIIQSITAQMLKHRGNRPQRDDECILVIARDG